MTVPSLANHFLDLGQRTLVMGVLNITPDSFSDGGRFDGPKAAIEAAVQLQKDGADIIDVGGESTRPGAPSISAEEEIDRVLPVIEGLADRAIRAISIDTTKATVAQAAIRAGAMMVNDISGFAFDPDMPEVVARARVCAVLSHTRAHPTVMQEGELYYEGGVVEGVRRFLMNAVAKARAAAIPTEALAVDPGIGFGKTVDQNLALLRALRTLKVEGCPVLVGTSRKSFLGHLTGRPIEEREMATAASVALSVQAGADIVRVHDVKAMVDVIRVADAWVRGAVRDVGP